MGEKKELLIEICRKCYLNCEFCSSMANSRRNEIISSSKFEEIINDIPYLNIEKVQISGGEPLAHPKILDLIKILQKVKKEVIIYTSGNLYYSGELNPIPDEIVKTMKEIDNLKIRFNLQSHKQQIQNKLTRKNSFNNTILSIKKTTKLGIPSEVHLIPLVQNYHKLLQTINFLKELGINKVKLLRFIASGRGAKNKEQLEIPKKEFRKILIPKLKMLKNKKNDFIEIGAAFDNNICSHQCVLGKGKICITPDLNVYPCVSAKNFRIFNFNLKNKTLTQLIKSKKYQKKIRNFRKTFTFGKFKCPSQGYIEKLNEKPKKAKLKYSEQKTNENHFHCFPLQE